MGFFKPRRSRLETLVANAEELLENIGDVASPHVRALKRELRSSLPVVKRQVRGYARLGTAAARDAGEYAVGRAREYPWVTLLVGAAVAVYALNATLGSRRD